MPKHKVATGIVLGYMRMMGYIGWTGFNNTVYYQTEELMSKQTLRKHELEHIRQINEEGRLVFTLKYLWYAVTVGYENNPYEVQAREAESID